MNRCSDGIQLRRDISWAEEAGVAGSWHQIGADCMEGTSPWNICNSPAGKSGRVLMNYGEGEGREVHLYGLGRGCSLSNCIL